MTRLLIGIFVLVVIFGALAGGKSFGGTVRKGCGCLSILLILVTALSLFMIYNK